MSRDRFSVEPKVNLLYHQRPISHQHEIKTCSPKVSDMLSASARVFDVPFGETSQRGKSDAKNTRKAQFFFKIDRARPRSSTFRASKSPKTPVNTSIHKNLDMLASIKINL